jgi:BTB/POZ domain
MTNVYGEVSVILKDKKIDVWWQHRAKERAILTLIINLEVLSEDSIQVYNSSKVVDVAAHQNSFLQFRTYNSLVDVTVNVKGKELKAHQAILAAASPV